MPSPTRNLIAARPARDAPPDLGRLVGKIRRWGRELGFQQVAIAGVDLSEYHRPVREWIEKKRHGAMTYMARNLDKRLHPEKLFPGARSVICVRMDYSLETENSLAPMRRRGRAYVARYARGRDYHRLMRRRLARLAARIEGAAGEFGHRAFVDSAPVLERALAEKSGLGWIGKNTMLINRRAGSWFFLGELYTNLPLPPDRPAAGHCGSCRACLDACPTGAFAGAGRLDASRCISYLTIELRSAIPEPLRAAVGNRIFGCDDCQLVCPWNKFAGTTGERDFSPRHGLDDGSLLDLYRWSEEEFLRNTEGSPIRRIGYERWRRNLAVALGNAETTTETVGALRDSLADASPMVREHVEWALARHGAREAP